MKSRSLFTHLALLSLILGCSEAPVRPIGGRTPGTGNVTPDKNQSGTDNSDKGGEDQGETDETETPGTDNTQDSGTDKTPDPEIPMKSEEELLKESTTKAMTELDSYLAGNDALADLAKQDFATLALSKDDAEKAATKIFEALKKKEAAARLKEIQSGVITANGKNLKILVKEFGAKPAKGHALFISLHGGGMTTTAENDSQWRNQITLYQPAEAIYVAPRAPTDTWDLWQLPHIDVLLERLIANYIIAGLVDPNRIYLMGYSAGGDGLYQLGPRLADRIAAGAMMAGHPGDASALSLRNIGFSIHCGANDSAYDRNKLAAEWLKKLDELEKANPGSYKHFGRVVAGKSHWMDLEDKEAVPWMATFTRNPFPKKVSWHQDDVTHKRFYWIKNDKVKAHTELNSEINGQSVTIKDNMEDKISVLLNDSMMDLSKPITIERNGKKKEGLKAKRTLALIAETLLERGDPSAVYAVELEAP